MMESMSLLYGLEQNTFELFHEQFSAFLLSLKTWFHWSLLP